NNPESSKYRKKPPSYFQRFLLNLFNSDFFRASIIRISNLPTEFGAFASCFDFYICAAFFCQGTRLRQHGVDFRVVVIRIVMKENEFSHAGVDGQSNSAGERTMSPSDVGFVFLVGVLRVEKKNVRALEELHQFGSPFLGTL